LTPLKGWRKGGKRGDALEGVRRKSEGTKITDAERICQVVRPGGAEAEGTHPAKKKT